MAATQRHAVKIRQMTDDDIDAVMSLAEDTGKHRDVMGTDVRGRLDFSFVAEVDGHVIGFVLAQPELLLVPLREVCIIQVIAVKPDYHRLGIGSRLVAELQHHCDVQGIGTLRALVPLNDTELRRWVENMGFSRSNIINYDKTSES